MFLQRGIRGYTQKLVDGEDYYLARTDEEFSNKIIDLLRNQELSIKMAHRANDKYNKYWSTEKFCKIVKETILNQ